MHSLGLAVSYFYRATVILTYYYCTTTPLLLYYYCTGAYGFLRSVVLGFESWPNMWR